jgi:hypothetical protein
MNRYEKAILLFLMITIVSFKLGYFYSIPASWFFRPLTLVFGGLSIVAAVFAVKNAEK